LIDVVRSLGRNTSVLRVVLAYALFTVNEYSVWIAVLVYAYEHGGATASGLIAVLQLVPAAVVAPFMAVRADRGSPVGLLVGGFGTQIAGLALAAVAADRGWSSAVVYAGAVVAATAITATRPAQAALLPSLARTPDELTAANAAISWVESIGVALAGGWAALLISRGVGLVLAAAIILLGIAAWLVALDAGRIRPAAADDDGDEGPASMLADVVGGVRATRGAKGAGVLIALLAGEDVVIGALDVLFVVIALAVLHGSRSWVGDINAAYGVGGVLMGAATIFLVGRRLPVPILVSSVVMGLALAVVPLGGGVAGAVLLLTGVGAARSVMDMATRTLLQRSVPSDALGRIFGLVEGVSMGSQAVGALLVPALIAAAGANAALIGVGCITPVTALLCARRLLRLDRESTIPVVQIRLLRSLEMFARLPPPAVEGLARAMVARRLAAGEVLIRQGEPGDDYFVIADGRLTVSQDGTRIAAVGRGSGVGEIALVHGTARTATVTADEPALVYALPRAAFLTAVTGHDTTRQLAEGTVAATLRADAQRKMAA
jgi:hypothetical protein